MSVRIYNENGEVKYKHSTFPGGEPFVQLPLDLQAETIILDARIRSFNDLGQLLAVVGALRLSSDVADNIHLFLPYFPGARQDRLEPGRDLTVDLYAGILNEEDFASITIVDPHSDVAAALLSPHPHILPIEHTGVYEFMQGQKYDGIIVPDAGARKRAERVAALDHRLKIHQCFKQRLGQDKMKMDTPFIPPGKYLVVDDILDGGMTFKLLFEGITEGHEEDYSIDLWATHTIQERGIFACIYAGYKRIGTTDSFIETTRSSNVVVYPLFERMENAV